MVAPGRVRGGRARHHDDGAGRTTSFASRGVASLGAHARQVQVDVVAGVRVRRQQLQRRGRQSVRRGAQDAFWVWRAGERHLERKRGRFPGRRVQPGAGLAVRRGTSLRAGHECHFQARDRRGETGGDNRRPESSHSVSCRGDGFIPCGCCRKGCDGERCGQGGHSEGGSGERPRAAGVRRIRSGGSQQHCQGRCAHCGEACGDHGRQADGELDSAVPSAAAERGGCAADPERGGAGSGHRSGGDHGGLHGRGDGGAHCSDRRQPHRVRHVQGSVQGHPNLRGAPGIQDGGEERPLVSMIPILGAPRPPIIPPQCRRRRPPVRFDSRGL